VPDQKPRPGPRTRRNATSPTRTHG
jgi:hypothetical protein